jgi:hypothetical protein
MPSRLDAAIDDAYEAFATYGITPRLDFAACVSASAAENEMLRGILAGLSPRELPIEAIDAYVEYVAAAFYDGGYRADELRHFLPRALELIGRGETATTPWLRERVEQVLERGRWRELWPAAETAVVDAVWAATDDAAAG